MFHIKTSPYIGSIEQTACHSLLTNSHVGNSESANDSEISRTIPLNYSRRYYQLSPLSGQNAGP